MRNGGRGTVLVAALVFSLAAVSFGVALTGAVQTEREALATPPPESLPPGFEGMAPDPDGGMAPDPDVRSAPDPDAQGEIREGDGQTGGDSITSAGRARPWVDPQERPATTYPLVTREEILGAVNQDLFQPDRTPLPERYALPGQRTEPESFVQNDRRRREPDLRIVGTAIAGNLGIALVQLGDSIPFAVVVGEEVDGLMVAAVDQESVTLLAEGEEFTFPVVEPDRRGSSGSRDRRSRGDDRGQEDAARVLNERIQQMLQRMGRGQGAAGGGGIPMEIPVGIQRLQQAGRLPGNVVIRTRPGGGGGSGP